MKTAKGVIDVHDRKLKVQVQDEEVTFNVFEARKHPKEERLMRMELINKVLLTDRKQLHTTISLERTPIVIRA
jgi:hypothetical protein